MVSHCHAEQLFDLGGSQLFLCGLAWSLDVVHVAYVVHYASQLVETERGDGAGILPLKLEA